MNSNKQTKLINYLINNTECTEELDEQVIGMSAQEIIDVLEQVSGIRKNLYSSSLGRELG
jgi:hypothetical protein